MQFRGKSQSRIRTSQNGMKVGLPLTLIFQYMACKRHKANVKGVTASWLEFNGTNGPDFFRCDQRCATKIPLFRAKERDF